MQGGKVGRWDGWKVGIIVITITFVFGIIVILKMIIVLTFMLPSKADIHWP